MDRYETLKAANIGTPCRNCETILTADNFGANLMRGGGECRRCEYNGWHAAALTHNANRGRAARPIAPKENPAMPPTTIEHLGQDATDDARELDLFAENEASLYPQFQAIIANLSKRIAKGTYDPALAPKLWEYWYDAASKAYAKEHGAGHGHAFTPAVRREAAAARAVKEHEWIVAGEYTS